MSMTVSRSTLLAAASLATLAVSGAAEAQSVPVEAIDTAANSAPTGSNDVPGIIVRDDLNPNALPPAGALDPVNINGVGQMVVDQQNGFLGTCTGTLINPRTVIFAAHCVNSRAASAYGAATGGTPISFGFQQNNIPGLRNWLGINNPATIYQTNTATAIYNVENVWYDPRSLNGTFIQADVALATLDTPATDIPTWAMLFTPLDQQEHVTVTGYGNIGTGSTGQVASGGFRRRAAENFVSMLGSLNDRNRFLFGSGSFAQNHYNVALTDPNGPFGTPGSFDFGIYGADDVALPREGSTAQGDSGSPLILDQKFEQQLIIGVLSGGSRFFGAQAFGGYGTQAFYQPLHAFWDVIVANNPYVYAANKAGDGEWTDAGHWVQMMDPSYQVEVDGALVNALPSTPGANITGAGKKFGDICFLTTCAVFDQDAVVVADGVNQYFVEGGPGSENFVPNNRIANPAQGIRPRYYDVTLSADGTTRLSGADVTIDVLTIAGRTQLDVASGASLTVLTDFNQLVGWTNINGTLQANEAFLGAGFLSGSGTLRAPFVTTGAVAVSPGGADSYGTLTIDGNLIMTSGTTLFINAGRGGSDQLAVTGQLSLSDPGVAGSIGPALVFSKVGDAPRHGQIVTIATAGGGIEGTFGSISSFQGVLRPQLTYGPSSITAELRAGALVDIIGRNDATARAFASALDQLREGSYNSLYNLYGMIDLMGPTALTATLNGLAPQISFGGNSLQQRQSRMLGDAVSDRLSMIGTGTAPQMMVSGSPDILARGIDTVSGRRYVRSNLTHLAPQSGQEMQLPEGFSGFISSGTIDASGVGVSENSQNSSYYSMGLESRIASRATFGMAIGYADGSETNGAMEGEVRTTSVAAYGAYDLGSNAYVGAVASFETVELYNERAGFDGANALLLNGASSMKRKGVNAELGINFALADGLTLTPRAQLGYDYVNLGGYDERGGEVALSLDDISVETVTSRVGAKLSGSYALGGAWKLTPQLKADYIQRVAGANSGLSVRFAVADSVSIALPFDEGEGAWGEVRGGLSIENGSVRFGAGFETAIDRRAIRDDRAMAEFALEF